MNYTWIWVNEGTQILAWSFGNLDDAKAFRAQYADDEDDDGARKSIDDLPVLPDSYNQRDNHETDTWVLVSGRVDAVEGIEPGFFRPGRIEGTWVEAHDPG